MCVCDLYIYTKYTMFKRLQLIIETSLIHSNILLSITVYTLN